MYSRGRGTHLIQLVGEEEGQGDAADVPLVGHPEYVAQTQDHGVPGADVGAPQGLVPDHMKHHVGLGQVRVPRHIEVARLQGWAGTTARAAALGDTSLLQI